MQVRECAVCTAPTPNPLTCSRACYNAWRKANPQMFHPNRHGKVNRPKPTRSEATERHRATRLGITVEVLRDVMSANDGKCACCLKRVGGHIDHDHLTGKIRGNLCGNCNTGIGLLGDTIEGVEAALMYLRNSTSL